MQGNDNPAFGELPSLFAYQPLENLKIVVAALASIGGIHLRLNSISRFVCRSSSPE
jgi:hypothetical protein